MSAYTGCPCTGATLDKLVQPAILAALMEGSTHGYRLAEQINELLGLQSKPDVSGVYRFLKKMESSGFVVSTWETRDTGHAKRRYQITPAGRTCLVRWTTTLETHIQALATLLQAARKAVARKQLRLQPPGKRRNPAAKTPERLCRCAGLACHPCGH